VQRGSPFLSRRLAYPGRAGLACFNSTREEERTVRFKAVVIGLILLTGLFVAVHRSRWAVAGIWTVLLVIAAAYWVRDLKNAMQRKNRTGQT
jgi:hypothetical protein